MVITIIVIFAIWFIFGVIWDCKQDSVRYASDYTLGTIFIGGPFWWIIAIVEVIIKLFSKIQIPMPEPKLRKK